MASRCNVNAIRELLIEHEDGMTIVEMAELMDVTYRNVHQAINHLKKNRLVYVDRWMPNQKTMVWSRVYCWVDTPEDAQRPAMKVSAYLSQVAA